MNIKRLGMSAALVLLTCGIAVAPATAATPEGDYEFLPATATGSSGISEMLTANGTAITCNNGAGSGSATTSTTGTGEYILHGCIELTTGFKFQCTSEGQPFGTIALAATVGHLVYLDEEHTIPGALATPPASGVFAKFKCAGGLINAEVKGNGILGRITAPKCGITSKSGTVVTEIASKGVQVFEQVEGTGTFYHLTVSLNGGKTFEPVATAWTVNGTSNQPATLTCPEQK